MCIPLSAPELFLIKKETQIPNNLMRAAKQRDKHENKTKRELMDSTRESNRGLWVFARQGISSQCTAS